MQILILKHDESEFLETVNQKLSEGYRVIGGVTVGTTSKSVGFWRGFPTGRDYFPVYSVVLDLGPAKL